MNQLSKEEKEELQSLTELEEFRQWKESQAVEKANNAIDTSGKDTTPFHFQDESNQNYVVGHVEDVKNKNERYFLSFELKEGEILHDDAAEFEDIEYEKISEESDIVIASGFVVTYPNARNYKQIMEVLGGLVSIKGTIAELESLKEESTFEEILSIQRNITEAEKRAFRDAAVLIFGISNELSEKADDLALIYSLADYLENHQELINEAQGLSVSAKKLAVLARRGIK